MAVVEVGGKQYRVLSGDRIKVERIPAEVGEEIILDKVLMAKREDGNIEIGTPFLEKVKVKAKVLRQAKDKKIIVYKFKRRKNYHRKYGHRQPFTELQIEGIVFEEEQKKPDEGI